MFTVEVHVKFMRGFLVLEARKIADTFLYCAEFQFPRLNSGSQPGWVTSNQPLPKFPKHFESNINLFSYKAKQQIAVISPTKISTGCGPT